MAKKKPTFKEVLNKSLSNAIRNREALANGRCLNSRVYVQATGMTHEVAERINNIDNYIATVREFLRVK